MVSLEENIKLEHLVIEQTFVVTQKRLKQFNLNAFEGDFPY
jgi:hypothetical protein